MATQRLLALLAGKIAEYIPSILSAGSADSGKVVALNAAGLIDQTMMPAGIGPDTVAIVASEALSAGALVNIWNNSGTPNVRNADANSASKEAHGYVLAAFANAATATVYFGGVITGLSGLTAGPIYLSDSVVGGIATAGATVAGRIFQEVGVAVSATSAEFQPLYPITRA